MIDRIKAFENFVAAGAFDALAARHTVRYASLPGSDGRIRVEPGDFVDIGSWRPVEADPQRAAIWQQLAFTAQVRPAFGGYRRRLRRMRLLPLGRRQRLIQTALALPGPRWIYTTMLRRRLLASHHAPIERMLDQERPDVVLHPSILNGVLIDDLLLSCRRRGIPTVVLINSWDNPSTKNATHVPPDWLLVWGEQTRQHAVKYMGLPAERVVPFGAPNLEELRTVNLSDARRAFRMRHGLGEAETVILYAASTIGSGDYEALQVLDRAIAEGRLPPCRIVYRAYPGEGHKSDFTRIARERWRNVLLQSEGEAGQGRRSAQERRQRNASKLAALAACDAVLSPLSTILLEAAMLGRPVLCYFPEEHASPTFRRANAPLVHFDDFLALPEVVTAGSPDDLLPATRLLLKRIGDDRVPARLRAASCHFVADFPASYAERLADFVDTLLGAPGASDAPRVMRAASSAVG